jgi:hypothetical protein
MTADNILLQFKYEDVVEAFAKHKDIPIRDALDFFYNSYTYQEMREGISDMHCRSDEYLAEELAREIRAREYRARESGRKP